MTFTELGIIPPLVDALHDLHYKTPTPIQTQAIPLVLEGRDLLGSAQTGTGKTAGFGVPLLQCLSPFASTSTSPARHPVRALVLLPTRELAIQVYESFVTYNKYLPLKIACIYGGVDMAPQTALLRGGVEVLIATPGRFLDHYEQKNIFLSHLTHFVLDEADRMLDMGFLPDISRIMSLLPAKRQTLLFSATFSKEIKKLADSLLNAPITVEVAKSNAVADTISHHVFLTPAHKKNRLLVQWLKDQQVSQALIFVDTKIGCNQLSLYLQRERIQAVAIHGDKDQQERLRALDAFRKGEVRLLVATDVAARGLDVENMPLVINYSLPFVPEDYIHRIGRTGRCGHAGQAVSFVSPDEEKRLADIEKLLGKKILQLDPPCCRETAAASTDDRRKSASYSSKNERNASPTLDFDINQPFVCKNTDFPKERAYEYDRAKATVETPLAALLGGFPLNDH